MKRPHQLFLGGDQIYADDVSPVHLHLIDLGSELIGARTGSGEALETLPVDQIRSKKVDDAERLRRLRRRANHGPGCAAGRSRVLPGRAALPATIVDAQMTSIDGRAICSRSASSRRCISRCGATPSGRARAPVARPAARDALPTTSSWSTPSWPDASRRSSTRRSTPKKTRHKTPTRSGRRDLAVCATTRRSRRKRKKTTRPSRSGCEGHRKQLRDFERGLAKVRRVLANIPTYMMFDDHDVTDDWNLNPMWFDRVYTTSLGVTIDPQRARHLRAVPGLGQRSAQVREPARRQEQAARRGSPQLFPPGARTARTSPPPTTSTRCSASTCAARGPVDGSFPGTRPAIKWHFSVPGPSTSPSRSTTARAAASSRATARRATSGSLDRQQRRRSRFPPAPLPDGKEVLLVIAPLQVIGPPLLDELVAPAAFRVVRHEELHVQEQGAAGSARSARAA